MEAARRGDLPLSEYAIIGDRVTAALVARDGAIDWLCYGRFDGAGVFCRLLDADRGGYFQVAPCGPFGVKQRRYVGRTNVLETEIECGGGRIRLTDAMPLGLRNEPTLLRRVDGLSGRVRMRVDFVPTFDFAQGPTKVEPHLGGCQAHGAGQSLFLASPTALTVGSRGAEGSFDLLAGETRWLALTHRPPLLTAAAAEDAMKSTIEAWERWSGHGTYPPRYEELLRRSALLLKLLIHEPTGAIVAAPTTSLPEDPGGERNWDYRFAWLRDASWLVSALMDLGYHDESMAFLDWLEALPLGADTPSVLFDVDGKPPAAEKELRHLRGYRASRPVRVGNGAAAQDQHDVFGEIVSAIHMCSEAMPSMQPLRAGLVRLVSVLADKAAAHWEHADHGMWEVRDRPRHFVSSKLLCWTALDRAIAMAQRDGLSGPLASWQSERARIRAAILKAGFDEQLGAFRQAFGESHLDATSLLLPRYGLLPADDPRVLRTVELIRQRLCSDGLVLRYIGRDGLRGTEGAFTACTFWLVDCLARQGRIDEAHRIFNDVVAHANDVGLLSEEIDTDTGELLGNYPQAFTHLALIRAAVQIDAAEQRTAQSHGPQRRL